MYFIIILSYLSFDKKTSPVKGWLGEFGNKLV